MIAVLVPSKNRPAQCKRMLESIAATCVSPVKVLLGLSAEDAPLYSECVNTDVIFPDGMPTVHKWNMLARKALEFTECKLFMLGSDDTIFATPLWDQALMEHYNALENKIHVYALQDSRDEDGTPHPIVTREWIEAMGYFMPPIFLHWFVDSWTVRMAKVNGCFTHMKDYLLVHEKPSDKGKPDKTHSHIREMGWLQRDKYVDDTCGRFLLEEKYRLATILQQKNPGHFIGPLAL